VNFQKTLKSLSARVTTLFLDVVVRMLDPSMDTPVLPAFLSIKRLFVEIDFVAAEQSTTQKARKGSW